MPRAARTQSSTGVYHIILRGVNKQQIFECSEDYECFIDILGKMSQVHKNYYGEEECAHIFTYSYCLMGNHVHILCKEADEPIGDAIKRITSSYVFYYNRKYQRVGHLFQERFKSQTVGDWEYFLTLMRYIHQNPLKPKLVAKLEDYPWSSWREYMGKAKDSFCCTDVVLRRAHEMGVGPRVLSRLTGVPYSIVQRATSAENERIGGVDMVCELSPEDEEWRTYLDDVEFEKTPEW